VKLFGRTVGKGRPPDVPTVDLPLMTAALGRRLVELENKVIQPLVMRAKMADRLRDLSLEPPEPETMAQWTEALDPDGWRRLALLLAAGEEENVAAAIAGAVARHDAPWLVRTGLLGVAAETPLLSLGLLRESEVRLEELARTWLSNLGVAIAGETPRQSEERRAAIDYARLLAEAERAKRDAEERMTELRKKQEMAERMRAGRSKF
jgi:hypothetical protein